MEKASEADAGVRGRRGRRRFSKRRAAAAAVETVAVAEEIGSVEVGRMGGKKSTRESSIED